MQSHNTTNISDNTTPHGSGESASAENLGDRQFAVLADSLPHLAWMAHADGHIYWYNRRWYDYTGTTLDQMQGWGWQAVHDPAELPGVLKKWHSCIAAGEPFEMVFPVKGKDGEFRPFLTRAVPIKSDDGSTIRWIGTNTEITEQKRAEEAARQSELLLRQTEARFHALADSIPQLAWMADENGVLEWFNRRWLDYTGTTLDANVGMGWKAVHHPNYVDAVAEKFDRHLREGKDWEDTFPLRGKDGQYRWFLSRMKVIRDDAGKILRYFGTNTDITDQRQIAEHLRELTAQLSGADRRKNEFLATSAHELRNPLAAVKNSLELLKRARGNVELIEHAQSTIDRQIAQMVRLVNDLLDVSRITNNKMDLKMERVELGPIVHHAVETCRPNIEHAEHELLVTLPAEPIFLNADPLRLAQVFGNLLNNACKYTEPNGRIWLVAERLESVVEVRVKDTGVGIPSEMLPNVFDLFTQIDRSADRSAGGLGIGLSLVKRLTEMHGGSATAHSAGPGKGSEFSVRLPFLSTELSESASTQ